MTSQDRINKLASVIEHGYAYDSVPAYWLDDEEVQAFIEGVKDKCMSQFYSNGLAFLCYGEPDHGPVHFYEAAIQVQLARGIGIGLTGE